MKKISGSFDVTTKELEDNTATKLETNIKKIIKNDIIKNLDAYLDTVNLVELTEQKDGYKVSYSVNMCSDDDFINKILEYQECIKEEYLREKKYSIINDNANMHGKEVLDELLLNGLNCLAGKE